ncbi:sensor domain-containing protein [Microbacterium horticulturae]|uniref:histidine kinase n=1 Tax=Microbacterium horticulturae TaxID=3028316 RepID=A0ABY8C2I2_9MICO|nr:sensor domain-containing protein [Microbacterium sp. KACC 23027]WEG10302.1 sensor domain-containing protein [Microbacterium sp. KACC 23027]
MTAIVTDRAPRRVRTAEGYGAAWRAAPGRALFLLTLFPLAIAGIGVLAPVFFAGVGLLILGIGLAFVLAALFIARGLGMAELFLLRLTGLPSIQTAAGGPDAAGHAGFWSTATRPLRNGHHWAALLHGMIVRPVVSTITFGITVAWLSMSLGGLSYWFWSSFLPRDGETVWGGYVAEALPWLFAGWGAWNVQVVLYLVGGVVCAVTLPWVVGGLARGHHAIARGMLGRWRSDDLAAEARAEASARGAAVHAEDAALRRLERDIHDGPQQRLVRLQMDLAALERRSQSGDVEAAAQLARESQEHARAALDELRALSSGVVPPLLQDRGLSAALVALGAAGALPATIDVEPGLDESVSPEIARAVYFVIAELLTNVAKHARATAVSVTAMRRQAPSGTRLDVRVVDNGRGGATARSGHGLEGLGERVAGLRGTFTVHSPEGGPTTIGVQIPLPVTR